jgi:hypothetical protein
VGRFPVHHVGLSLHSSHLPNLRKLSIHVVHQDQVARVSQFHFDQLEALCVKRGVFYERFSR